MLTIKFVFFNFLYLKFKLKAEQVTSVVSSTMFLNLLTIQIHLVLFPLPLDILDLYTSKYFQILRKLKCFNSHLYSS